MDTKKTDTPARAEAPRRGAAPLITLGFAAAAIVYGVAVAKLPVGAPLVMLGIGGLALGLVALAVFRVVDPLLRPAGAGAVPEAQRAPVRRKELEREKQLVLKAIREIEHDHQMRKISDDDHQAMTARYRARAMRLLREIDAGDDYRALIEQELKTRLAAVDAARKACPACHAANEADADFCKKCGKAMRSATPRDLPEKTI